MAHVRQQIRDAFIARLSGVTGVNTVTGARAHLFALDELPALSVVAQSETMEPFGQNVEEFEREIAIEVTAFAAGDSADDALDDISAEVESLILTATGEPWDSLIFHRPVSAEFTIGEAAAEPLFTMRTRFAVRFSATDAETVGTP